MAVLGFKCRVMQLQAQGGSLPKQISPPQQLGPHVSIGDVLYICVWVGGDLLMCV